ncbi:MAG: nucleotidyltransferase family protein [Actinomycetota bacterium]|nr:nucleotidyltransferase family protein [Actinomycetota bacterium]
MRQRERDYADVLGSATRVVSDAGMPFVVFGSIASSVLARPSWRPEEDIDLLLRPDDVRAAVGALDAAGFDTMEHDPTWIFKATRDGITVDLIFRAAEDVFLDDEMLERAPATEFLGVPVRLIPPEDLAVVKAMLHSEDRGWDWFDAIAILRRGELDWDYLVARARLHGPRRVASLRLNALSAGAAVPAGAVRELVESAAAG